MTSAPRYEGLPVVGALLEARRDPLALFTRAATLGDVVAMNFGPVRAHLVNHPALVEDILHARPQHFGKQTRSYRALREVLGNGLLTSEGSFWLRQRRLAQPAFHRAHLSTWASSMVRATERWLAGVPLGARVDLHEAFLALTLEIVGETLFSSDVRGDAAREISEAVRTLLSLATGRVATLAVWPQWLPTPGDARFHRAKARLDAVVQALIDRRRREAPRDDLLGSFIAATDADTGERMTDGQLKDEVLTLLLAGHETTANALAFTVALLGREPELERAVRAELSGVLGGRVPTLEDLPSLRTLDGVIHEGLRLFPPVWTVMRSVDVPEAVGGVFLAPGTVVFFSPFLLHRRAQEWPHPERVDPGRWLTAGARPRCAFMPFSTGPRKCIGDGFALLELQLVLATLFARSHFDVERGSGLALDPSFTLRPKGGLWATRAA